MKNLWLLILCVFLSPTRVWTQEDFASKITVMCPTSDSIEMATDVFLPEGKGPFPVILIRTPYNKNYYASYGRDFSKHGFAVVIQDVRGKWASGGEFYPFIHETTDGISTLEYIDEQNWSNGNIGIFGESYPGFCGLTLSASEHQTLKTVFQMSGWAEPHKMAQPGGAGHIMLNIPWLLNEYMQNTGHEVEFEIEELFEYLPQKEVFRSLGIHLNAWEKPDEMQDFNSDFDYEKVKIPIFHAAGWYDFVGEGTIKSYLGIDKSKAQTQHLIIGPWFHNQMETTITDLNEIEFSDNGIFGHDKIMEYAISWFNCWLKNIPDPKWKKHKVSYYVLFENEWRESVTWPPKNTETFNLYLHSMGKANTKYGDGTLIELPQVESGTDQFTFDPNNPVPTNGGANFHFFPDQMGIIDQNELEEREDILVFTSEPFQNKNIVAGPVKVEIFASTDAPDTDFTAKLVLVDKVGKAWNIVDAIIRARYREGFHKEKLLIPGSIQKYILNLGNTAFRVNEGERLRLEISSSNFPKYDRNSNSLIHPFEAKELKLAHQRIYHSKEYPSFIQISIINENQ